MRIWIKICATTCVDDALASIEAGANALGFVFAPSKRCVSAEQAAKIVAQLPGHVERVGVFSDESAEQVAAAVVQVGLNTVQLHGEETPEFIDDLAARWPQDRRVSVIKTVLVDAHFAARFARTCQNYPGIDSILLDSGAGSGRTFDWETARPLLGKSGKRLIVAGGLNPENVGEAIRKFAPWGVDVVSGVEREPGRKDPARLKAFVAAVRKAEQL
ncbi:MAG TPA: phosphoribosylanthranilate isomerase [Candidatus Angelobacter sp.]